MYTTEVPVLIVGAGIAGLAAGKTLQDSGVDCCILEKSRGLGGRCASRRFHGASFDHGAQFFTTRNSGLQALTAKWVEQEAIREWCFGFPDGRDLGQSGIDGYPRYCSSPGMNQLGKLLATSLTVENRVPVTEVLRDGDVWKVSSECGREWQSQALLMTPPLPQTLGMLTEDLHTEVLTRFPDLESVDYAPCFTVMLSLTGPSHIPMPGAIKAPNAMIDWLADNSQKHRTGQVAALTVHTSADFSRDYFDRPQEDVAAAVIDAVRPWLGSAVEAWQVHRWRYARPSRPLAVGTLALGGPQPLVLAGDYLNAPARIEGAFDSGVAAATYVLESN
jgi:renalase